MKLLMLSCNTGEGHNSAAHALAEAAQTKGHETQIVDPLSLGTDRVGEVASSIYNRMIQKVPELFGLIYRAGDLYSSTGIPSPVYRVTSRYAARLREYIAQQRIDAVISTHLYGMEVATAAKRQGGLPVPCFSVLTDYTCIPFLAETRQDLYFIPHADLKEEFIRRGIPEEKICCDGIPVRAKFSHPIGKEAARNRLILPRQAIVYLLMTGGEGSGDALALCRELLRQEKEAFLAIVLAGRNSQLKEAVEREFSGQSAIQSVCFTEDLNLYMEAADVILSKPGGLSSTEIAALGVPLVHTMTIPGCETQNAAFFKERSMSFQADSAREAAASAWTLAHHAPLAEKMREAQRKNISADAAERIIDRAVLYALSHQHSTSLAAE